MELKLLNIQRGISAVLTGGKTIPYRGQATDAATLGPIVAAALAPYENVHNVRSALRVGLDARRANVANVKQLVKDIQSAAQAAFQDGTDYEQFGFKPRKKPSPLTPEEKQVKVEKLRLTRAARHTMGSRQKAAVKGVTPGNGTTTTGTTTPGGTGNTGGPVTK
ncbi:MAG TPA: hypothetical protein VFF73_02715 [Planctomycetota bacterium]|nr:hypothetical protein [Planctomycetota bacterium]